MSTERPGREVAYRLLAAEYDDASLSHAESDEERAPNFVVTPTGARVNRLFVVGTLTEITPVNDEMLRARVVDPTGAFVVYAGQYQPDELAVLEQLEPPEFVAVTGKARTFQPDDSDRVYTSIRPESVATVDADTRDRWVVSAAERTLERVGTYASAAELEVPTDGLTAALLEADVDENLAKGIPLAQRHYGTTPAYLAALRTLALDATRVVAGERDQVGRFDLEPGETGADDVTFADLATVDVDAVPATSSDAGGDATAPAEMTTDTASDGALDEASVTDAGDEPHEADGVDAAAETAESTESTAFDEEADVAEATSEEEELGDFESGEFAGGMYEMDDDEREELEAEFGSEFSTGTEVDAPGEAGIDGSDPEDPLEVDETGADGDGGDQRPDRIEDAAEVDGADGSDGVDSADDVDGVDSAGDGVGEAESAADEQEPEAEPAADVEGSPAEAETDADESEPVEEPETETDASDGSDVDLTEYVVETMNELDDGDGADRKTLVERAVSDVGATEDDVEDAIQDALMGGQCFEPDDETLKPI